MARRRYDVIMSANYSPWSRYSGGGQKSVHMLAEAMSRQGKSVAVIFSKAPWETVKVPAGLNYDLHWAWFAAIRPGISSPLRFLNGIFFRLKAGALSGPETVLHGNGDEAALFAGIAGKNPFVYTNRYPEFPDFLTNADWKRPLTWLKVFFREPRFVAIAMGLRTAGHVAVTSDYSRRGVSACFGIPLSEVEIVANGIDPIFLESEFTTGEKRGVVFYGRLTRAKGPDRVLEAYALLPEVTRELHPLVFLGSGPLQAELEARSRTLKLGNVRFHGWQTGRDLVASIQSGSVVCLPSREESFGNCIVESLALGQNVISSTAGSIPEVVGPLGRLIAGESDAELSAALAEELSLPRSREEMSAQREAVRARYSWDRAASRYLELYAKPMNGMGGA